MKKSAKEKKNADLGFSTAESLHRDHVTRLPSVEGESDGRGWTDDGTLSWVNRCFSRGRGANSSSLSSLFYLSLLASRAFTLSIALTSLSLSLSFSLFVAISRHPLSPGSGPSARVFRDQKVKFALGSKCSLSMRMGVGMLGCRVG